MNAYGMVVVRVRAKLVDGYGGQQVRDWDNAEREQVAANVQPRTVREDSDGRQVVTDERKMHTAGDFTETDRVEWDGKEFEVTGVEQFYQSGRLDHTEATLKFVSEVST